MSPKENVERAVVGLRATASLQESNELIADALANLLLMVDGPEPESKPKPKDKPKGK